VATDFTGRVHSLPPIPTAALVADVVFTAGGPGIEHLPRRVHQGRGVQPHGHLGGSSAATANTVVRAAAASQVTLEGLPAQVVVDVSQNVTRHGA